MDVLKLQEPIVVKVKPYVGEPKLKFFCGTSEHAYSFNQLSQAEKVKIQGLLPLLWEQNPSASRIVFKRFDVEVFEARDLERGGPAVCLELHEAVEDPEYDFLMAHAARSWAWALFACFFLVLFVIVTLSLLVWLEIVLQENVDFVEAFKAGLEAINVNIHKMYE